MCGHYRFHDFGREEVLSPFLFGWEVRHNVFWGSRVEVVTFLYEYQAFSAGAGVISDVTADAKWGLL